MEVAVVDADERGLQFQGAVKFRLVMHLDQHIHAIVESGGFQLGCTGIINHRHDQQNAIRPPSPGLRHLISVKHEVLAQGGKGAGLARFGEELRGALEARRVSQYRQARSTSRFKILRQ